MEDEPQSHKIVPHKTLWTYLHEGIRRANARRPMSFYLLLAIPIGLLLGIRVLDVNAPPKRFAFYLGLIFIFFFALIHRAIVDFIEIARRHFSEHEKVFRSTLGDQEFITKLGRRVSEQREK